MLLTMMLMLFVMIDPALSAALGAGMSFVLNPTIGFGGHLPVISVFFAGAITGVLSTGLRHWSSDYIALERGRLMQKSFQKELSEARLKRDVDRIERLKRAQPFVMSHTMEANYATMRPAVGTMVVALAVFGWLNVFLSQIVQVSFVSLPWASSWPLHGSFGFPYWVILYMVMSLPLTVTIGAVLKLWRYRSFDPKAPLKTMPTVEDLIRRAEGQADDGDLLAKESARAKRRLKQARAGGGALSEDDGGEARIVDADESTVEIVDAEEDDDEGEGAAEDESDEPGVEGRTGEAPGSEGEDDESGHEDMDKDKQAPGRGASTPRRLPKPRVVDDGDEGKGGPP